MDAAGIFNDAFFFWDRLPKRRKLYNSFVFFFFLCVFKHHSSTGAPIFNPFPIVLREVYKFGLSVGVLKCIRMAMQWIQVIEVY